MVARAQPATSAPGLPSFGVGADGRRSDPARAPAEIRGLVGWWQVAELAAVVTVGLGLALSLPLATSVFALLLFGVLHNYFELRYVVGRFGPLFSRRLFEATLLGLTVVVVLRLLPLGGWGRPLEIVAVYGLLAVTLVLRLGGRPWLLAAGLGIVALALVASLAYVEHHFVVITHLHNVLPLVFLWEWLGQGAPTPSVRAFRGLHLTWAIVLPALLLAGLFDGLMSGVGSVLADWTPAARIVGDVDGYVRAMTPPGGDTLLGARLLAVFALLQLLHYYVWCRFFPSVGAVEVGQFNQTMLGLGLPRGRTLTGLVLLLAGLIFALMWADFQRGRSLYAALAGYHAYLEYTLLLLFVVSWRRA
ncbi:MAG: hypothetical protein IT306_24810 [Chloroflexi bacterium]|nr:hypothetical protein [Chloroflexota bacterium]